MNNIIILLTILTLHVHAQDVKYPEPDFSNVPMWYDPSSGTLKSFERSAPNQGTRMKGMASAEVLIFFANETSTVPFTKLPIIIFKMNSMTEDPSSVIELGKLQVNRRKHQREYIMGQGGFGGSKTTVSTLQLDFKKCGNGCYLISPSVQLEPGEYCFNVGKKAFLFSIPDGREGMKEEPHPHDPLGEAIYRKIQERKAKKEGGN